VTDIEFGIGSALAVIIFLVIFVFSIIATKILVAREVELN